MSLCSCRPLKPADEGKGSALNPRAPADSQESIADTSFDVQDPRSLLVEEIKQRKMRIDQLSNQLAGRIDGKVCGRVALCPYFCPVFAGACVCCVPLVCRFIG